MIRVIIEHVPGGDDKRTEVLYVAEISNITNLSAISDYIVHVRGDKAPGGLVFPVHRHERDDGVLALIGKMLANLRGLGRK